MLILTNPVLVAAQLRSNVKTFSKYCTWIKLIHLRRHILLILYVNIYLVTKVLSNYLINKVKSPRYWVVLLSTLLQSHFSDRPQSQSIVEGKSFYSHGSRWDNADGFRFQKVPRTTQPSNNNWLNPLSLKPNFPRNPRKLWNFVK